MAEDAVSLLFQVAGGGSVNGKSGGIIAGQISSIVKQIEAQGTTKLKFGVDTSKTKTQLSALTQQMNQVTAASTKIAGSTQTTIARISSSYNALKNTVGEINNANRATVSLNKAFNNLAIAKGKFDANPNSKTADVYRAQQIEVQNLTKAINDEVTAKEKLERTRNNADWNNLKYDLNAENQALRENDKELKQIEAQTRQNINTKLQYNKILSQSSDYYKKYSDNIKKHYQLNKDWQSFNNRLSTDRDFLFSQEARYQLSALQQATREAGADVETLKQKLGKLFDQHLSTAVAMVGIHLLQRSLRELYTNVFELDKAFTQLQIVSKATDAEISKFGDDAAKAAQKIGSSITDIVEAATVFSRLGFNSSEALDLSKYTTMYSKIANVDIGDAESNITSIVKAFDISTGELEATLDKMVETGNNFPISAAELGEGLQNSASALGAAGNSLSQSLAILTASMTTTQDISKASTATRTITARLQNSKTELEALGETLEADYNTTAKYRDKLLALSGVDILEDDLKTFRSTYDILNDISAVWDDINSIDQASITTMIAGVRQSNVFQSIMGEWKEAQGVMEATGESSGALAEAQEIYLDSIEGKLSQTKATVQSLSSDVLNSGLVKFTLDLANGTFKAADGLAKIHMLLPAIALSIATIKTVGRPKVFNMNNIEYLDGFTSVPTVA